MTVTFFAIDHSGAIVPDLEQFELNVPNMHAVQIERMLGFRPQVEEYVDIPGGEKTIDDFLSALLAAVLCGASMGHYARALADLAAAAHRAGAEVIAWG